MKSICPICLKSITIRNGKFISHTWDGGGGWIRFCAGSDSQVSEKEPHV